MAAPFFLILEGLDGTGKTTVMNQLHLKLYGELFCLADRQLNRISHLRPVFFTREPGSPHNPGCQQLRDIIFTTRNLDEVSKSLLFVADHLIHMERVVRPALANGQHVITDRTLISDMVYHHSSRIHDRMGEMGEATFGARAQAFDRLMAIPNKVIFYFEAPPFEVLEQRLASRNETMSRAAYEHLDRLYDRLMEHITDYYGTTTRVTCLHPHWPLEKHLENITQVITSIQESSHGKTNSRQFALNGTPGDRAELAQAVPSHSVAA